MTETRRLICCFSSPSLDAIEGLADAPGVDAGAFFEIVAPAAPYGVLEVPFGELHVVVDGGDRQ